MNTESLSISIIRVDGGTQPRARTSLDAVSEYAEAMESGAKFPPVVVFYDGSEYWLADGFHRRDAAIAANLTEIKAEVKQGTLRDAVLYSVGVNTTHGLRRTNDDKRRAVIRLLEDSEWSAWSDREIARRCNVSRELVGDIRPVTVRNDSENTAEKTYTTKHGTTATMNTARIGKARTSAQVVNKMPLDDNFDDVLDFSKAIKNEPTEKSAARNHIEAKRVAAYESVEFYLDSIAAESRHEEIQAIRLWLDAYEAGV